MIFQGKKASSVDVSPTSFFSGRTVCFSCFLIHRHDVKMLTYRQHLEAWLLHTAGHKLPSSRPYSPTQELKGGTSLSPPTYIRETVGNRLVGWYRPIETICSSSFDTILYIYLVLLVHVCSCGINPVCLFWLEGAFTWIFNTTRHILPLCHAPSWLHAPRCSDLRWQYTWIFNTFSSQLVTCRHFVTPLLGFTPPHRVTPLVGTFGIKTTIVTMASLKD